MVALIACAAQLRLFCGTGFASWLFGARKHRGEDSPVVVDSSRCRSSSNGSRSRSSSRAASDPLKSKSEMLSLGLHAGSPQVSRSSWLPSSNRTLKLEQRASTCTLASMPLGILCRLVPDELLTGAGN